MDVFDTITATIAKGNEVTHRNSTSYMLVSWQLATFILASVYTSLLYGALMSPQNYVKPFDTVSQMVELVEQGRYTLVMPKGISNYIVSRVKKDNGRYKLLIVN